MNDGTLIGRLRDHICVSGEGCRYCEAADEIGRLREMLSHGYKAKAIGIEADTVTASADGRGTPVGEMIVMEFSDE